VYKFSDNLIDESPILLECKKLPHSDGVSNNGIAWDGKRRILIADTIKGTVKVLNIKNSEENSKQVIKDELVEIVTEL